MLEMKRFVKVVVVSVMMLGVSGMVYSQEHEKKRSPEKKEHFEKIEAAKVLYFEQELKLADKEKEKFWTAYNAYKKSLKENSRSVMNLNRELYSKMDSISDKEVKLKFESILALQSKEVQLKKDFVSKSADVIGYKRTIQALELERAFKKQLMDRVKDGKESGKRPQHKKVPSTMQQRIVPAE